jgi:glycosyltransferase involved in cell wall biosynthesis
MAPDISIIIPSKNRLWALPKAIESCRSKDLKVQIIVIDDASTDRSIDWLTTQTDVTVVEGEGWGKPWAVNKALPLATGKYLRYLDSDDWLNAGANEAQFVLAEREQADVVVAGMDIYQDETLSETQTWIHNDDFIAQQLGETAGSHYSAFLFRRDFVKDIPHRTFFAASNFASNDDRCFMLEVALRHPKTVVYDRSSLCHRHHRRGRLQFPDGIRSWGANIQHLYIYKQILSRLKKRGELNDRRRKVVAMILWNEAHKLAHTHLDEACALAEEVFELDPSLKLHENATLKWLYTNLGFKNTERLLRFRRRIILGYR